MALVAWAPKGMSAPIELTAVRIKPGKVTRNQWLDALANRVTDLAMKSAPEETAQACRYLGLPVTDNPREAGLFLVLENLNLQTNLNLSIQDKNPFPATVGEPSQDAKDALQLNLMEWVDLASSMVSESSLD